VNLLLRPGIRIPSGSPGRGPRRRRAREYSTIELEWLDDADIDALLVTLLLVD